MCSESRSVGVFHFLRRKIKNTETFAVLYTHETREDIACFLLLPLTRIHRLVKTKFRLSITGE